MTSLYASEIAGHFSERDRDVKAFLFVQTNREVARDAFEARAMASRNSPDRIRMVSNCPY